MKTVAIVGGGPAGSVCALTLARAGVRTLLFERDCAREKPCGGGLTRRAFKEWPELADLKLNWREVHDFRLVGPSGRVADLALDEPVCILARNELDGALRREAIKAGAALLEEPARAIKRLPSGGWQINDHAADVAIGAGGMNDPVARAMGATLPPEFRAVAVGRFVPGDFEPRIVCRFFPEQQGYAWFFPRPDHASLGVELMHNDFQRDLAWDLLRTFAKENLGGLDVEQGKLYGWSGPAVFDWSEQAQSFGGDDWMLIGDAAGAADVTTGEGLSYALGSGRLAAQSVLMDDVPGYGARLRESLVPELAKSARLHPKFYRTWFLRLSILALSRSRTCRATAADMTHGRQSYLTLKQRVYREMPRMAWEMVRGT